MISGYLLRDVINKVERHPLHLPRGAPHPRPCTRRCCARCATRPATTASSTPRAPSCGSWSTVTDPQLGETVLDPACGTGGFLVEAYNHLEKQCKTVADRQTAAGASLFGGEAKPLPYLLCQMNLLLHGLEPADRSRATACASS